MRVICHISKKTARYLLTSGLVPCIDTGKKTRQYIINTKDVITYLKKRQSQPEKFSAPTGYYSASWNKGGKPKMLTLREWANLDTAKSRKILSVFYCYHLNFIFTKLQGQFPFSIDKFHNTTSLSSLSSTSDFDSPTIYSILEYCFYS